MQFTSELAAEARRSGRPARRLWAILAATSAVGGGAAILTPAAPAHAQAVCASLALPSSGLTAAAAGAIACGDTTATATGVNSSAFGQNAKATADSASAVGLNSTASGTESTAVGFTSLADGLRSVALGGRSKADATFATAVGWANTASGLDSFAGGNKSVASGASSVALGDVAQAKGDQSVAIGAGATTSAAGSVALGAGAVADQANTVSVGTATAQRRITNVAAGTDPSDAATVGQLQALQTGFDSVDQRISAVSHRADSGTAAAMAVAGLPQAFTPGKGLIGLAVGTWRSETAFAFGASKALGDGHAVFKAGATFDQHGTGGFNAGVGWQF